MRERTGMDMGGSRLGRCAAGCADRAGGLEMCQQVRVRGEFGKGFAGEGEGLWLLGGGCHCVGGCGVCGGGSKLLVVCER